MFVYADHRIGLPSVWADRQNESVSVGKMGRTELQSFWTDSLIGGLSVWADRLMELPSVWADCLTELPSVWADRQLEHPSMWVYCLTELVWINNNNTGRHTNYQREKKSQNQRILLVGEHWGGADCVVTSSKMYAPSLLIFVMPYACLSFSSQCSSKPVSACTVMGCTDLFKKYFWFLLLL